jgi:cell division protein FtsQ
MKRRPLPRASGAVEAPAEQGYLPETRGASSGRVLRAVWSGMKLVSGVAIVVCASVAVAWGAHRYALTTPRFAVRSVEIEGNRRKSDAQILELAGLSPGTNLFAIDLSGAERRLLEDPWIKQAKITRQLPGTLQIHLGEREPAALAVIGGLLYLLTPAGEPFKQVESGDPVDLPVVTGIEPAELGRDRARAVERLGTAVQVLRHYERIPMSQAFPAQEVHLTDGGDVVLTVGKQGVTLHLGKGPWRKKLLMASQVETALRHQGQVPGIVFLDNEAHPERVVVRMR